MLDCRRTDQWTEQRWSQKKGGKKMEFVVVGFGIGFGGLLERCGYGPRPTAKSSPRSVGGSLNSLGEWSAQTTATDLSSSPAPLLWVGREWSLSLGLIYRKDTGEVDGGLMDMNLSSES